MAIGHIGATAGTLTSPTGPLVDLANGVPNVDAVIGDHTDQQVLTTARTACSSTENRSKGLRFTRVRLVIDPGKDGVVYKTADFHKPWNIGVTPDAAIQAKIDDLNAQLAPIFNTVIGKLDEGDPARGPVRPRRRAARANRSSATSSQTRSRRRTATDFAITNSGGLRADLTCPTADLAGDFCSAFTPPPFPISRGQVLGGAAVRQHRRSRSRSTAPS